MKLAKNLGIAGIAAAISVAAISARPAQAALLKYDFSAIATSGANPGEYFGSFSFDDSALTNLGLEDIGVEDGLKVAFNYLGTAYDETDDEGYDSFPVVSFQDGKLVGLNYFVADQFYIGNIDFDDASVGGNKFYNFEQLGEFSSAIEVGTVTYTKVPEPLSIGGIAIAGTLGLWLNRKKKASQLAG